MSNPVSRQSVGSVPDRVAPIAQLMSSFPAPWAFCGGWAVDSWIGRSTREHEDIDIVVFVQDQQALLDHLAGWQLVGHDSKTADDTNEPWNGRPLSVPGHIHARLNEGARLPERIDSAAKQGFSLDIQLNERNSDDWVLSREPRISRPLSSSIQQGPWGVPTVVPEILLFFKSLDLRRRDKLDFAALLPHLAQEQRDWLQSAIALVGHPWLPELQTAARH